MPHGFSGTIASIHNNNDDDQNLNMYFHIKFKSNQIISNLFLHSDGSLLNADGKHNLKVHWIQRHSNN